MTLFTSCSLFLLFQSSLSGDSGSLDTGVVINTTIYNALTTQQSLKYLISSFARGVATSITRISVMLAIICKEILNSIKLQTSNDVV